MGSVIIKRLLWDTMEYIKPLMNTPLQSVLLLEAWNCLEV